VIKKWLLIYKSGCWIIAVIAAYIFAITGRLEFICLSIINMLGAVIISHAIADNSNNK